VYSHIGQPENCQYNASVNTTLAIAEVMDYMNCTRDEGDIAEMFYEVEPLATAVDATGWQFYQGVNIVGYGSENGTDYWIVRNC